MTRDDRLELIRKIEERGIHPRRRATREEVFWPITIIARCMYLRIVK